MNGRRKVHLFDAVDAPGENRARDGHESVCGSFTAWKVNGDYPAAIRARMATADQWRRLPRAIQCDACHLEMPESASCEEHTVHRKELVRGRLHTSCRIEVWRSRDAFGLIIVDAMAWRHVPQESQCPGCHLEAPWSASLETRLAMGIFCGALCGAVGADLARLLDQHIHGDADALIAIVDLALQRALDTADGSWPGWRGSEHVDWPERRGHEHV